MSRLSRPAILMPLAFLFGLAGLGLQALGPHALGPPALAQPSPAPTFAHDIVVRDAERLDLVIKTLGQGEPAKKALAERPGALRSTGLKQLADGADPRAAVRTLSLAVAADVRDRVAWLGLARAFLAVVPDANRGADRFDLPSSASGAAWRAYQLATAPKDKAAALAVLADAMKRRSMWRPAIDALKASVTLDPQAEVQATLETLRAEHGFRVVDYKTESDAAEPRLCINFSERLAGAAPDVSKFVTLDGREPETLTAEGSQLCLDGLKHGARYAVHVRRP